jgi:hypothetical protein
MARTWAQPGRGSPAGLYDVAVKVKAAKAGVDVTKNVASGMA